MIRVFEPKIDKDDIKEVSKTLFETNISGTSPVVREFETKLAKKFDRKYAGTFEWFGCFRCSI